MDLTIDRRRWRTGQEGEAMTGEGITVLLNDRGYMCCLGFLALAMGAKEEQIYDVSEPDRIAMDLPLLQKSVGVSKCNSDFAASAIQINDKIEIDATEREDKIEKLFAKNGINVTFINDYVRHGDKLVNEYDTESDVSEEVKASS